MRRIFAIAAAATLLAAPAALAAPSQEGAVSAEQLEFKWTGQAYGFNMVGEPCNTDHSCEDILVEVEDPGFLTVSWTATAPAGPAWLAFSIYESDETGAEGESLADGGGLEDSGSVGTFVEEGFYLVRVAGLLTTLADYEATATLEPDEPIEETP
jgi:hypothetical protein